MMLILSSSIHRHQSLYKCRIQKTVCSSHSGLPTDVTPKTIWSKRRVPKWISSFLFSPLRPEILSVIIGQAMTRLPQASPTFHRQDILVYHFSSDSHLWPSRKRDRLRIFSVLVTVRWSRSAKMGLCLPRWWCYIQLSLQEDINRCYCECAVPVTAAGNWVLQVELALCSLPVLLIDVQLW